MKVNSGAKKIKKISLYMYMYLSKKSGKLLRKNMPLSFYRLWSVSGRCIELAGHPSLGRNTTTNVCNIWGSVPQNI